MQFSMFAIAMTSLMKPPWAGVQESALPSICTSRTLTTDLPAEPLWVSMPSVIAGSGTGRPILPATDLVPIRRA